MCAHQTHTQTHTHTTSRADVSLLVCLSSVTVTTRSSVSQQSELPGHQKERNASKSDKAQCSFCGSSETRPSLSPTHICTIISRCLQSPSQPAYRKLALRPSVYYSIFSVATSGSAALHFLNSVSGAHVPKHPDQKSMQMLGVCRGVGKRRDKSTEMHSPLFTPVLRLLQQKHNYKKSLLLLLLLWLYGCIIC